MVRPAGLSEPRLAIAVVLAATIAATAASRANAQEQRAAFREACGADVKTVCSGVPRGGERRQCMIDHFDQLSDGCKSAIKQMQAQSPNR
jgi:hypothetical protein